ncbi:major outer membrane protein [Campylobacter concisus]|uniref:major outer membrane protein n=1 Tax=Campylobacter concisus TaxID=199 RepID=UPI000CD8C492|nr:major outer membrane protein [Campylobacter concisus]
MKLTKISLAALVALGAFSSVASATPLEEAIKNVDLSGFARYRYTNDKRTGEYSNTKTESGSKAGHGFKMVTNFKAAIDDNFFGVIGLRYNATDNSGDNTQDDQGSKGIGTDKTDTTTGFGVHQFYLGYKIGGTTITAGKQEIGSYFTDDAIGTGVKVVNQDIEGLTLTGLAFDALEGNSIESNGDLYDAIGKNNGINEYDVGNLYAVGIAGSYSPIDFQLWYASLTNLADLLAADVTANFAINDDISLGGRINYVNSNADIDAKSFAPLAKSINASNGVANYNDGNFYAGELTASLFGLDARLGYMGWKVQDKGVTSFSFEDQGSLINVGELTLDHTWADGKANLIYATAGYTFDKFTVGADYIKGHIKHAAAPGENGKEKVEEITPRFAYAYSKKLTFSSYYAFKTSKFADEGKNKEDQFRFEAKYSF